MSTNTTEANQTAERAPGRITSRVEGGVGHLIFDNEARRNAISLDMARQVPEALQRFAEDPAVRVVIVSGAGEKSFISGADISEFEKVRNNAETARQYSRTSLSAYDVLRDFPKPTIAKIRGFCFGGGVAMACACDLRLAADDALFSIPAARLGIGYRAAFTKWVVDAVGPANAKEILITARRYDAAEALRIGLVHRVVPAGEFDGFVAEYAAAMAENAPLSMKTAKFTVNQVANGIGAADLAACEALAESCTDSEDFREGRRAFMEKRRPEFQGR